jgi:NAD(P)-dependent dehydrogenase (short-subunit alcohol dehydrogenase family)
MSFAGKVVAITGGASGIGLAAAQLLASKGAELALADAQEKALLTVQQELAATGAVVDCTVVDIRSRVKVEAWVEKVVEKFGKVDALAICAGVTGKQINNALIQDIDDDDWDFVLSVNLKGSLNTLRAFIPNLNDGASIVTIASLAGLSGIARDGAYVASKHAVVGLSRTATIELGPRGIRVNCICP